MVIFFTGCASFFSENHDLAQMHLQVGTSQMQSGNYPQALSELLIAETMDGSDPFIQNNLGLAYFLRERVDLAEVHIRKALYLKGDYSDARNNLSRVLIERGKYEDAILQAQMVVLDLTFPNPEKPLVNLGTAYFKMGNFSEARKKFLKAIEYRRDNCLANSFYGRSLFELKEYKRASEALDRAVGFCQRSQFDEPHYYSALAYFELGQREKSEMRFEEMIKLYPQGKFVDKAKNMLETIRR